MTRWAVGTAGPRGTSAAAGEGAAGRIVGVLGSSRSTTGGSTSAGTGRAGGTGRLPPQARYSPCVPAPQRASRRSSPRSLGGRRSFGAAGRQARNSPFVPAPHSAARRDSEGRAATGAGAGARRAAGGATNGTGAGRAIGAGRTERSGTARTAPERDPGGREAAGRRPGEREPGTPSTRSRTSIRPARLLPASRIGRSANIRAAVPVRAVSLLMSPPAYVVSAAGEGAADKEKGR